MSLIAFLIFVLVAVLVAWVVIWILGQAAPGHPAIIDRIIWIVVVVIILFELLEATGLLSGGGPMIPRVR